MNLETYRPVTPGIKLVMAFCRAAMLSRGDEQPWYLLTALGEVPAHRRETVVMCRCGRRLLATFDQHGADDAAPSSATLTHVRLNAVLFGIRDRRWTFHVGQCSRCQACLWAVRAQRTRNRRVQPGGVILAPGRC